MPEYGIAGLHHRWNRHDRDTDHGFGANFGRRHALGESDCSLHIVRSFDKTRCPWLLSPSNKALATAPVPSGMVGRFAEAPVSCLSRKVGSSDG